MWIVFVGPALARSSRRAAWAWPSFWNATLHGSTATSSCFSSAPRSIDCIVVDCVAHDQLPVHGSGAIIPTPNTAHWAASHASLAAAKCNLRKLPLDRRVASAPAAPTPPPRAAAAAAYGTSAATQGTSSPELPPPTTPTSPAATPFTPTSPSLDHISGSTGITAEIKASDANHSPLAAPQPRDQRSASATVAIPYGAAAAAAEPMSLAPTEAVGAAGPITAAPGPSSALLRLMGLIHRSRSAVDLRVLLFRHQHHQQQQQEQGEQQQEAVVDHVALVAAMSRLAKMSATSRRAAERVAQRQLVAELAAQLAAPVHLRRCGARQLATCLHSLAEVGVAPGEELWRPLLDALCDDRAALLRAGNGVDVSMLALALARLNCPSRRAWRAVAHGVEAHAASMSPQHVANTLSALARGGAHEYPAAFTCLLRRAVDDAATLSGRNIANALWAAVRHLEALGALPPPMGPPLQSAAPPQPAVESAAGAGGTAQEVARLSTALAGLTRGRLWHCPPTELAGLAWSLARLGWRESEAWERLGAQLRLSAGALKPAELCTTAEALQSASAAAWAAPATAPSSASSTTAAVVPTASETTHTVAAAAKAQLTGGADAGVEPPPSAAAGPASAATAVARVDSMVAAPRSDPAEHLTSLFAAAALRSRELRPPHLARLLAVLRQHQLHQQRQPRAAVQRSGEQRQQRQQGAGADESSGAPAGESAGQGEAAAAGDPVLTGFVEEARAQLLRTPPSAFSDLVSLASLVSSLACLRHQHAASGATRAGPTFPATGAAGAGPAGGVAADDAPDKGTPALASASASASAAVLDHLAAAAVPLVATASAADLQSVVEAFAAAGHFNAELCTAAAARIEGLASQVDTHRITTGLQQSPAAQDRQGRRQRRRQPQRDPAVAAAVCEVADLVATLRSLARLRFHNDAALDAVAPAVAVALPALPPPALAAALTSYTASGAPPLALSCALAARLLELLPPPPHALEERGRERSERPSRSTVLTALEAGGQVVASAGGDGLWFEDGLGGAARVELLEACRQWRGALLYPGGLAGAAAVVHAREGGGGDGGGEFSPSAGGLLLGSSAGAGQVGDGGEVAVFLPVRDLDRCTELVLRLRSRAAG